MLGNVSKEKRDKLIAKIQELKNFISDKDSEGKLSAYLNEIENEITSKKFGLVFEEHREEIDDVLEKSEPVLTEQEKFLIPSGKVNFLIEGDNLASLKLLEKTHKGAIDVIYIDPPYYSGVYEEIFCKLAKADLQETIIIVEHSEHINIKGFYLIKEKNYGGKFISFYVAEKS